MEIKGNARRILKFLSERSEAKSFYPTALYNKKHINVKSRDELDKEINILYDNGLVSKDGENIMLTSTGKAFIEQIEADESKEIFKDIFTNYDLAILKYFYRRNEPLNVDELPEVFGKKVERHFPNGSDDYNLMQYLQFTIGENFTVKNQLYELSEIGKQYLSHLLSAEEKNQIPAYSTINIHQQTGDNININGGGNTIIQDSTLDKTTVSPTINKGNTTTTINPRKNSWIEKAAWIVGIAAGLAALYEFVIKRFF